MLSEFSEAMQTTKATLSISGLTFFSGIAAGLIDIIPEITALFDLILGIYTLEVSRKRELREHEMHNSDRHDRTISLKPKTYVR